MLIDKKKKKRHLLIKIFNLGSGENMIFVKFWKSKNKKNYNLELSVP